MVSGLLPVCLDGRRHGIEDKDLNAHLGKGVELDKDLKALTRARGSSFTSREDSPYVELEAAEGINRSARVRRRVRYQVCSRSAWTEEGMGSRTRTYLGGEGRGRVLR